MQMQQFLYLLLLLTVCSINNALRPGLVRKELVIWDCDGVLVDSEALLKQGEVDALRQHGFQLTRDDCTKLFSGYSPEAGASNFKSFTGKELPKDFFKEQVANSLQLFKDKLIPLMHTTVLSLHNSNVRQCVASGSPRERVNISITKGGMDVAFRSNNIFTREDVTKGKPAPDLFLLASNKMNVESSKCIVIEDSVAGVLAAKAAGMDCAIYLGGGHAEGQWYRDAFNEYTDVPRLYTPNEVLTYIKNCL